MSHPSRAFPNVLLVALAVSLGACSDPSTAPAVSADPTLSAVKFWEAGSSVAWNRTARELIVSRGVTNPAQQIRILAYLSVAQYNAVVAAEAARDGGDHASPAAAAAGASLVVLKGFFSLPADVQWLDDRLRAQLAGAPWPGEQRKDVAAGEAIGRAIGAEVVAYAATDGTNQTPAPANPGGAGNWTGTNPALALYRARTFVLTSSDQFPVPPPPTMGSPEFVAALAEVRALSDGLTTTQLATARRWAPIGAPFMNGLADELIVAHRNSEREAARVLALANMAGFDGLSACFEAKFTFYLIRPTQVDNLIKLPVGLPNHPSYPSGHSCITSAYATVLAAMFPDESGEFAAMVEEAGLSRMYAGLHYRFDCEAGQELGRQVAGYVLQIGLNRHTGITLD